MHANRLKCSLISLYSVVTQPDVETVCFNLISNIDEGCVSEHDLLVSDGCAVINECGN